MSKFCKFLATLILTISTIPCLAQSPSPQINLGPTNTQVKGVLQPTNGGTGAGVLTVGNCVKVGTSGVYTSVPCSTGTPPGSPNDSLQYNSGGSFAGDGNSIVVPSTGQLLRIQNGSVITTPFLSTLAVLSGLTQLYTHSTTSSAISSTGLTVIADSTSTGLGVYGEIIGASSGNDGNSALGLGIFAGANPTTTNSGTSIGEQINMFNFGSGTVGALEGLLISSPQSLSSGVINNWVGLDVSGSNGLATTAGGGGSPGDIALLVQNNINSNTPAYSIYQEGTAPNYFSSSTLFAGNTSISTETIDAVTSSPTLILSGEYEASSGPTYAPDAFSWQNIIGPGVNGNATLTLAHAGTSGTASVSFGSIGVSATTFTGALSGNATTATALASTPTQCSSNNFATGIAASGNANCATPPQGTVTSVTGTVNQIVVTNGTTAPVLSFPLGLVIVPDTSNTSGMEFDQNLVAGAEEGTIQADSAGAGNYNSYLRIEGNNLANNYIKFGDGAGNLSYIGTLNNILDDGSGNMNLGVLNNSITSSPTFKLSGSYEATSGPTYAADYWTYQNVVGAGVNGTSTLTFAHTGSTGALAIAIPGVLQAGTDGSVAGSFQASNSAASAHTAWGSGATTTNTIKGFATAPTTGDLVSCTTATTTCTLTDSSVLAASVVKASSPGVGIAHFAGSTQTVTSSAVVASDFGTQTANTFLAGPTSGAAATPTFRAFSPSGDCPTCLTGPNTSII